MRDRKHILIYPAGQENAIGIFNALKYNLHFELFGASMVENHARFIYDDNHYYEGDLDIRKEGFIDRFNAVIEKFKIDYILCNHDEVSPFLIKNQDKINAVICLSPYETAIIAENKKLTADTFSGKYYMPTIYEADNVTEYPIFAKPFVAAGGKGALLINNEQELKEALSKRDDLLLCEYLPGDEYTVDCFTDRKGNLLFVGARTRDRITNGITYHSERVKKNGQFEKIANDINNTLKFRGAWFFQLKRDRNGELKLLEICIRQAGTMTFYREYGFNFPALTLFDFMGQDIEPLVNDFDLTLDRCIHNSYKLNYDYDNVYIDFDDTLIVRDQVNTTAIKYIYQCKNTNKNIYLISRHAKDIQKSLKRYNIDKNLFKEIYILDEHSTKSDFISTKKSILIDNYFAERKEVHDRLGIPVFDVDAIECLISDAEL